VQAGLEIGGLMGTSAGALSGSLYAAGYSPERIAYELSRLPPVEYLQLSSQPWSSGGILNMNKVVERYRELLPPTFDGLKKDFAVGVYTKDGRYTVLDSGPLPEAVVASAAIPVLFEAVDVPGPGPFRSGRMLATLSKF
jgi:NTE family protein